MRVVLQGDTHGNTVAIDHAFALAQREAAELVIQVGDFGYGWRFEGDDYHDKFTRKVASRAAAFGLPLWWIDGNHENFDHLEGIGAFDAEGLKEIAPQVFYVPRGLSLKLGDSQVLFVGGAHSVDKPYRKAHVSWWPQEELTTGQVIRALDTPKADVVISHDVCDTGFRAALSLAADGKEDLDHLVWKNDQTFPEAARNRLALEHVFIQHHPKYWYHGHYHCWYEAESKGTWFNGLAHELHNGSARVVVL